MGSNPPTKVQQQGAATAPYGTDPVRPVQDSELYQRPSWTAVRIDGMYEVWRFRGTSRAHDLATCPERMRTAEISTAGQSPCRTHRPRPRRGTVPSWKIGCPAPQVRVPHPPRGGRTSSRGWTRKPTSSSRSP